MMKKNMNIVFFFEKMIKNLFYIILVNWFYIKLYIEMIEIVVNIYLVIIVYKYYLKFILNY